MMEYMQKFKEKAIERFCRWGKIIQRFPFRKEQPVYCRYSSLLGKYLAFQVLKPLDEEPYPERIGIQFLDWSGDDFISKDVFTDIHPWGVMHFLEAPVPRGFQHMFNARPLKVKPHYFNGSLPWYNWDRMFAFQKRFSHLSPERKKNTQYKNANGSLDLRGGTIDVEIQNSSLENIFTDESIASLSIIQSSLSGTIQDPLQGAKLRLSISGKEYLFHGLERLTWLSLTTDTDIDLNSLAATYPSLQTLNLFGQPGKIHNLDALRNLSNLEVFFCFNMFGFDGKDMPLPEELPKVFYLEFDTLPTFAASQLRTKWNHIDGVVFKLSHTHKPEWFLRNKDNPFCSWNDSEELPRSIASRAEKIYRNAKKEVLLLNSHQDPAVRRLEFIRIIQDFVGAFNTIDAKKLWFASIEREKIYDAGYELLRTARDHAGIVMPDEEFSSVFDEKRNW